MSHRPRVTIYTDGACAGNPGPGGWGAVLMWQESQRELFGGEPATTNNRMELRAVVEALNALKGPCDVALYADSQYVLHGISQWIKAWKKNGWKTAARKPVKNSDLWQALDEAAQRHTIAWHWVKGHAGNPDNERVDALARAGMLPYIGVQTAET